jgi:hypothetical protein
MEATRIITQGALQEEIHDRCTGETWEETRTALQDMASGHDPIYQFAGWIWTADMVVDAYNEYKADVIEALTELSSYGDMPDRAARSLIEWQCSAGLQWIDIPQSHADFAARCLGIAITYHAGELFSQVEQ